MRFDRTLARFVVLSALLASASARGTLIMALCNGDSLYLGSDSLETTFDYSYTNQVQKIRAVGDHCCVSLSGLSRWTSQVVKGSVREIVMFAAERGRFARMSYLRGRCSPQ